jgi:hypothetical protein
LAGFVTLRVHKSPSGINLSRLCRNRMSPNKGASQ